jgi:hypothetical protein
MSIATFQSIALSSCNANRDIVIKMAIFPVGTTSETYYIILKDDKTFECSIGVRKNNNINSNNFMKSYNDNKKIELSSQNFQDIINLAR